MSLSREYNITLQLEGSLTPVDRLIVKRVILSGLAESTYTGDYEIKIPCGEEL